MYNTECDQANASHVNDGGLGMADPPKSQGVGIEISKQGSSTTANEQRYIESKKTRFERDLEEARLYDGFPTWYEGVSKATYHDILKKFLKNKKKN
jgi:hypothetical protein